MYYDPLRPRFDPYVSVNVLAFFYANGRGHELPHTLDYVHSVLLHRAYLEGTRYYISPDCFLFFITRLLTFAKDPQVHARLGGDLFRARVQERINMPGDGLALAMRIVAANFVGLSSEVRVGDFERLLEYQCEDGGWDDAWIYQYGMRDIKFGNRGFTTAVAIQAVRGVQKAASFPDGQAPSIVSKAEFTSGLSNSMVVLNMVRFHRYGKYMNLIILATVKQNYHGDGLHVPCLHSKSRSALLLDWRLVLFTGSEMPEACPSGAPSLSEELQSVLWVCRLLHAANTPTSTNSELPYVQHAEYPLRRRLILDDLHHASRTLSPSPPITSLHSILLHPDNSTHRHSTRLACSMVQNCFGASHLQASWSWLHSWDDPSNGHNVVLVARWRGIVEEICEATPGTYSDILSLNPWCG